MSNYYNNGGTITVQDPVRGLTMDQIVDTSTYVDLNNIPSNWYTKENRRIIKNYYLSMENSWFTPFEYESKIITETVFPEYDFLTQQYFIKYIEDEKTVIKIVYDGRPVLISKQVIQKSNKAIRLENLMKIEI